jgi:hypothetical protein
MKIIFCISILLVFLYTVAPAIAGTGEDGVKVVRPDGTKNTDGVEKSENFTKSSDNSNNVSNINNSTSNATTVNKKDDGNFNPLDAGVEMVGRGVVYGFTVLADEGFKVGFNETADTSDVRENYGVVVSIIYTMATIEFDPSSNEFIKEIQLRTNIIGIFLILFYVLMGGISVNWYSMTSAKNRETATILSTRYHIPINEYGVTIAEGCLMMIVGYSVLRLTLKIELILTKLIMLQILDRITPTGENTIMYIMMSICYVIIGIAIAYRLLCIALFHASYLVFVGLYCFGMTREVAWSAFIYYLKILFLRPIIVGVTVIGVGIISTFKVSTDINPFLGVLQGIGILYIVPLLYAALILILMIICIKVIFGISNIFHTSRKVMRYARYKV